MTINLTEEEYNKERGYDPDIDYIVGALLQMYSDRNINNVELVDRDENFGETKGFENSVFKCVKEMKPLVDDIAESTLRGSKFFLISRFWEERFAKKHRGTIGGENPAMVELREIAGQIMGFKFNHWYMMKNENYGRPYQLVSDYLVLNGGNPTTICEIYNIGKTFVSLKEFHGNIVSEYTGDFSEIEARTY